MGEVESCVKGPSRLVAEQELEALLLPLLLIVLWVLALYCGS